MAVSPTSIGTVLKTYTIDVKERQLDLKELDLDYEDQE
jgi:hypothetical protein